MSSKTVLVDGGSPAAVAEGRFTYNLLPVGKFYDKRYGVLDIGPEMLGEMERNFGKYPSYEVPVKLGHDDGAQSPGKVVGARATKDGLEIIMDVDAETAEAINKKRYRYMSAEFTGSYSDKRSGKGVGAVLLGAALVNQPANPYMEPLVLVDDIEPNSDWRNDGMEKEAMELLKKQLSDAEAREKQVREELEAAKKAQGDKDAEAKAKEDEAQKKIAELEAANKALNEEKAAAETAQAEAEVKAFCETWTSKGVPPAVLEKVRPVLLSEGRPSVVKLSDKESAPLMKVFGDVFESMSKIPMGQIGSSDAGNIELSDVDKARTLGASIAATVNGASASDKK